ncbi:MAG: hypothetical protein MHPSP_001076, partial [Paramarteilia canceri]
MLGDVAIGVSANSNKYLHLKGCTAIDPLTNNLLPIVVDNKIDSEVFSSACKLTPAHSPLDYEICSKIGLEPKKCLTENGRITCEDKRFK